MELKFSNFIVTSDKYQYTLQRLFKPTGKLAKNEESISTIGYYTDLEFLLTKVIKMKINDMDTLDIKELINKFSDLKLFIKETSDTIKLLLDGLPQSVKKDLPNNVTKVVVKEPVEVVEVPVGSVEVPAESMPLEVAEVVIKVKAGRGRPKGSNKLGYSSSQRKSKSI